MGSGDIEVQDRARTLKLINTHNREHIDKTKHAIKTKTSMCSSFQLLSTVMLVSSKCGCKCVLFDYED